MRATNITNFQPTPRPPRSPLSNSLLNLHQIDKIIIIIWSDFDADGNGKWGGLQDYNVDKQKKNIKNEVENKYIKKWKRSRNEKKE